MNAPGPLTISAIALFGNESFYGMSKRTSELNSSSAAISLCQSYRVPFLAAYANFLSLEGSTCYGIIGMSTYEWEADEDWGASIAWQLLRWFTLFNDTDAATAALGMATYYASDALLTHAQGPFEYDARTIYSSDGRITQKPSMSLPSLIVLSVLLAFEVAILLHIAYYAWETPAWTNTFKSATVAQLANALDRDTLPPAGCSDEEKLKSLRRLDGRIGVAVRPGGDGRPEVRQLVHGGTEPLVPLHAARLRRMRLLGLRRRRAAK